MPCKAPRIFTGIAFTFLMELDRFDGADLPQRSYAPAGMGMPPRFGQRQARGRLRNFSRKRPETTNLNHQRASRRVFISFTQRAETTRVTPWIARPPRRPCELFHNRP